MKQRYVLDYLELPSTDGPAMQTFMANAFGWTHTGYGPEYIAIHAGIEVGIDSSADRVVMPLPIIRAEDLDQAERDIVSAGGTITLPQFDYPGGRRFHFRSPGGVDFAVYVDTP
jgi:hypothetical protein